MRVGIDPRLGCRSAVQVEQFHPGREFKELALGGIEATGIQILGKAGPVAGARRWRRIIRPSILW